MNLGIKKKTAILVGFLLITLFVVYAPVIPRTTTTIVDVTIPKPDSSIHDQVLELTIPLTTTTFHIQTITLPYDQRVNITLSGTGQPDLVAFLSNTSSEAFIQSLITEVGVPIGPTLFTGTDLTPIITAMIREKLPSILERNANGDYYKVNAREDASSLDIKAGTYNLFILSLGHLGESTIKVDYRSSDSMTIKQPQTISDRISILSWLIG